ncbi:MAG: putative DNA modification/repair radical SAM protein [Lachnospiraceae bacterium]|jgi:putative DNA modification/repair radical SAM protein
MEIMTSLTLQEKLNILADAAKYDVACTSSGIDRRGEKGKLGNSCASGICHSFASDGRCISLLKILMSNDCIYDCKYCLSRSSNEQIRTTFTPDEVCRLVIEFYRRNYIEGLFLSSAVCKNPTYTMELMYQTLLLLRTRYCFHGYIHVKAIPGAPAELLNKIGYLTDRMSVNLELPTAQSLEKLAPNKTYKNILKPMEQIRDGIAEYRLQTGKAPALERHSINRTLTGTIFDSNPYASLEERRLLSPRQSASLSLQTESEPFVPAGQSTQMIIGASPENDYQLLTATQKLYQHYDLKRVFFSAYIPLNEESCLPALGTPPPLLREHRLYQADWLLRFYGFHAEELLSPQKPNFNILLDPKCDWALRHLDLFPVEINTATSAELLRVPGIGIKSVPRILQARKQTRLDFQDLKKIGVVLKRAKYFITCSGKMMYHIRIDEDFLTRQLTGEDSRTAWEIEHPQTYRQMSLFDDMHLTVPPTREDSAKSLLGQL